LTEFCGRDPRDNNQLIARATLEHHPELSKVIDEFFTEIDVSTKKPSFFSSSSGGNKKQEKEDDLEEISLTSPPLTRVKSDVIAGEEDENDVFRQTYW
jgi:hypothetical protein